MSADRWTKCPRCGNTQERDTFREDWDIGLNGKEFSVSYLGECSECKLFYKHEHEMDILWDSLRRGAVYD